MTYAHKLQDSVKATRHDVTPVVSEWWVDMNGRRHPIAYKYMIEARGDDGSYVRGLTATVGDAT